VMDQLTSPAPANAGAALSPVEADASVVQAFGQAVVADLHRLACLHDREVDADILAELRAQPFQELLGLTLKADDGVKSLAVLDEGLATLPSLIDGKALDLLAADFAAIYLNHTIRAHPSESVWVTEEHLVRQEPMLVVRQWYRRYYLSLEDSQGRPDDHLVFELQFLVHLFEQVAQPDAPVDRLLADAAQFLDEHPLRWVGPFTARVAARCQTEFYAGVALVTYAYLDELRSLLAEFLDQPRPTPGEVEARLNPNAKKGSTPPC